jgi:hypothetical protein
VAKCKITGHLDAKRFRVDACKPNSADDVNAIIDALADQLDEPIGGFCGDDACDITATPIGSTADGLLTPDVEPECPSAPKDVAYFDVNGYPLAYREEGSDAPLILIHGSFNDYRASSELAAVMIGAFHLDERKRGTLTICCLRDMPGNVRYRPCAECAPMPRETAAMPPFVGKGGTHGDSPKLSAGLVGPKGATIRLAPRRNAE